MTLSSLINLSQPELVNLAQSLACEILSTNHSGGYLCTTAALCNTRKYHGLMVLPLEHFGGERHVLLSTLDEAILHDQNQFNLSLRRYPSTYEPRGHKYLESFSFAPTPTYTYRIGNIRMRKELLFLDTKEQLLIKYTLEEATEPIVLRIMPFLAFRNAHQLCQANMAADTKYDPIANGIAMRLSPGFPTLHLQTSTKSEYVHAPHWHYNLEYMQEQARGYDAHEDLLVPGYIDLKLAPGRAVILSAATHPTTPARLSALFNKAIESRPPRSSTQNTLEAASQQFIADRGESMIINAGYPWFGRWGRDTLIALPGLTLATERTTEFERILSSLMKEMRNGMLPNMGTDSEPAFNSVDAPLWLFATVQTYCLQTGQWAQADKLWGKAMRTVFETFADAKPLPYQIALHDNGLIWAGQKGYALTWMDAIVHGQPVTPRIGYAVEINALWYNACQFILQFAEQAGWKNIPSHWQELPSKIQDSFRKTFIVPQLGYLADYVDDLGQHIEVRPNQIFAAALPYSPIDASTQQCVVETIRRELYTPLGLRTLSPKNPAYRGRYQGSQPERDTAYHQGTIWTWLLEPYVAAYERVYGAEPTLEVTGQIVKALASQLHAEGLGTLSEVYDGDPPHTPGGTIAQAWSVSAAMTILKKHNALKKQSEKK